MPGQRVEGAEGFVEEQDARAADQGARQGDALPLTAGEHRRPVAGAVGKPDIGQRLPPRSAPAGRPRDADIAEHALPGQQTGILEEQPNVRLQATGEWPTVIVAAGRPVEPGDQAHQGASCRRRNGRRRQGTARPARQVEIGEHLPLAERFRQLPNHRPAAGCRSARFGGGARDRPGPRSGNKSESLPDQAGAVQRSFPHGVTRLPADVW